MLSGKSPKGICRPKGRSDHWLGSRTEPSVRWPGSSIDCAPRPDVIEARINTNQSKQMDAGEYLITERIAYDKSCEAEQRNLPAREVSQTTLALLFMIALTWLHG